MRRACLRRLRDGLPRPLRLSCLASASWSRARLLVHCDLMPHSSDTVLRAITDDGAFRVITARTTDTVRGAVDVQGATGSTARAFGELLTGAILYRETMAPQLR